MTVIWLSSKLSGENIDDYDNKHKEMIAYLKSVNPLIGTTKQK